VVTSILAVPSDMDSGTAMTISVGDAASGTRFLSASTMGQAGTLTTTALTTATGLLFKYTTETEIQVTITLQATTAVAGTIALYLTGFIDN
jgi:purine nucleoside permease